jgi:hypothetical protein
VRTHFGREQREAARSFQVSRAAPRAS